MTFADFQKTTQYKNMPKKITKEEFENMKHYTLDILEKNMNSFGFSNHPNTIIQKLNTKIKKSFVYGNKALELLFFPLFFIEANRQQTPINFIKGISELTAFYMMEKQIMRSPLPTPVKLVASAATGIGASLGANLAFFSETAIIDKWRYFQKSNYNDKFSVPMHLVTSLGLNEILQFKNYLDKKTGLAKLYEKI